MFSSPRRKVLFRFVAALAFCILRSWQPRVAEQKCQCDNRKEFFQLVSVCHVRDFEIKSALLEVAKELLNSPSLPVKREGFPPAEAIAH